MRCAVSHLSVRSIYSIIKNTNHTVSDLTNENAQYFYCANGAPALLFTILFTIVFSVHLYQCLHYKAKYCWVICMASAWEAVGFLLRTISTANQIETTTATPAGLLVLLAPLWVNAFDYVVFGRMIWYYLPDKKIAGIRAQKMATCFVWLDVV
jgi:RTA1 like protein